MTEENTENNNTVEVELSDGSKILMHCTGDDYYDGEITAQGLEIAAKQAFGAIKSIGLEVKEYVAAAKPDKATVEFSIELEQKGDSVISKICGISGKGGLKVMLEWNFPKEKNKPPTEESTNPNANT